MAIFFTKNKQRIKNKELCVKMCDKMNHVALVKINGYKKLKHLHNIKSSIVKMCDA